MDKSSSIILKDIITRKPVTIDINAPFSKVVEYFHEYHIRHLPVVDDEKVLRGIVSQRDLYRVCAPRRTIEGESVFDKDELDKFILRHVMTKDPFVLGPLDTLERAIDVMVTTKYGCIPVVDQYKRLLGIVTQIDILRAVKKYFLGGSVGKKE